MATGDRKEKRQEVGDNVVVRKAGRDWGEAGRKIAIFSLLSQADKQRQRKFYFTEDFQ
jgi:hypothetical protein